MHRYKVKDKNYNEGCSTGEGFSQAFAFQQNQMNLFIPPKNLKKNQNKTTNPRHIVDDYSIILNIVDRNAEEEEQKKKDNKDKFKLNNLRNILVDYRDDLSDYSSDDNISVVNDAVKFDNGASDNSDDSRSDNNKFDNNDLFIDKVNDDLYDGNDTFKIKKIIGKKERKNARNNLIKIVDDEYRDNLYIKHNMSPIKFDNPEIPDDNSKNQINMTTDVVADTNDKVIKNKIIVDVVSSPIQNIFITDINEIKTKDDTIKEDIIKEDIIKDDKVKDDIIEEDIIEEDIIDIGNDKAIESEIEKILKDRDLLDKGIFVDQYNYYKQQSGSKWKREKNKIIIEEDIKLFYYETNVKIKKGDIPDIDKLIFGNEYNHKIKEGVIPSQVKEIIFGLKFDKVIVKNGLSENLEKLEFGCDFNKDLVVSTSLRADTEKYVCVLPSKLKSIKFGYFYNREIKEDSLPSTLETLIFGKTFNKKIKNFPPELKYLEFGSGYQHIFTEGILPTTLTHLILGSYYNQEFKKGVLPKSLENLKIENTFNHEFKNGVLPKKLISLELGDSYDREFKIGILPPTLKILSLGDSYVQKLTKNILPSSLVKLKLGTEYDHEFTENVLPDSIETLELGETYSHKITDEKWPKSMVNLILAGSTRNIRVINNLPNINEITFRNLEIDIDNLPSSLQLITVNKEGRDKIKKVPFGCEVVEVEN